MHVYKEINSMHSTTLRIERIAMCIVSSGKNVGIYMLLSSEV